MLCAACLLTFFRIHPRIGWVHELTAAKPVQANLGSCLPSHQAHLRGKKKTSHPMPTLGAPPPPPVRSDSEATPKRSEAEAPRRGCPRGPRWAPSRQCTWTDPRRASAARWKPWDGRSVLCFFPSLFSCFSILIRLRAAWSVAQVSVFPDLVQPKASMLSQD